MAPRMHGYNLNRTSTRPPDRSFANVKEQMADRTGWTKKSNEEYARQLREEDRRHKEAHGKNSGRRCDRCVMEDHDRCWRVGCYCPCIEEKRKARGDAWPARKLEL